MDEASPVFEGRGYPAGSLPVTEEVARTCVSLPLYPEMSPSHVERVAEAIRRAGVPAQEPPGQALSEQPECSNRGFQTEPSVP